MTKFPPRTPVKEDPVYDDIMGMCDCGHPSFKHPLKTELKNNNPWDDYGECMVCMCPYFSLQHTMTFRQYEKIQESEM